MFAGATSMCALILLFQILGSTTYARVPWWGFAAVCAGAIVGNAISRMMVGHIGRKSIFHIRVRLARQIVSAPLIDLERMGTSRLIACFAADVGRIAAVLPNCVFFLTNLSFVFACLFYLGWLSLPKLGMLLPILGVGVVVQFLLQRGGLRHMRSSREKWADLLRIFRALVNGAKELKLNTARRAQELLQFEERAADLRRSTENESRFFNGAATGTQFLFFSALGLAIFDLGGGTSERHLLAGYSISIIYMMGPLRGVIDVVRNLREAGMALARVEEMGVRLERAGETDYLGEEQLQEAEVSGVNRESLSLTGITHSYCSEQGEKKFTVGPIDLVLKPGEVVFVIGENGSGKTTLAKLMTGLYAPQAGEVRFNGRAITEMNREWYSQHFSAIFSDFYLFDKLIGPGDDARDGEVGELLRRFKLESKVRIQRGSVSTVTSLSDGERKRLALLFSFLEDRSIYVFDEWAADQDPEFKDVFYGEILQELRTRRKMVVVISHDDRYFSSADKIVMLERGAAPCVEKCS
jgi:putative ATP-binding cassette transporter